MLKTTSFTFSSPFNRRPLSQVIKKAPKKLWQSHRQQLTHTELNPNSKLHDADSNDLMMTRRHHLKTLTNSSYSIKPIRTTTTTSTTNSSSGGGGGVIPMFVSKTNNNNRDRGDDTAENNNNRNKINSFDYIANGFIWPLYKPPYVLTNKNEKMMIGKNFNNNKHEHEQTSGTSLEEFIFKQLEKANSEFKNLRRCPFDVVAQLEMNKILDDAKLSQKYFSSSSEKSSSSNLLLQKIVTQCEEVPFFLALAWAINSNWSLDFNSGVNLPPDIGGICPVAFFNEESNINTSSINGRGRGRDEGEDKNHHFNNQIIMKKSKFPFLYHSISHATFEAVVFNHIPKAMPGQMMKYFFDNNGSQNGSGDGGVRFYPPTTTNNFHNNDDVEEGVELVHASVVRHGYYLQEPVSVLRWELFGKGCAHVLPNQVLSRIFSANNNTQNGGGDGGGDAVVVGDPSHILSQQMDIPCPMVILRGVTMMDSSSASSQISNNRSSEQTKRGGRLLALPQSPYSREEMISSTPNAMNLAIRKASLTDGLPAF